MKKNVMVALLLGILLVSPLIQAQALSQTYSGFDRFIDNIKLFFSFGDNKVRMALSIKEKEINSSIENFKNGNEKDSSANLERAWERLQFIQEKVSRNTAREVKENSNETRNRIIQEGNLTKDFEVYVLEEEKTELTAEWVIEMNVTEGQNKTWEIETRIDKIDDEISNWVVEHSVEGEEGDEGLVRVVKTEVAQGDNGLKPEVKTYVQGDGTQNEEPLPEPDLNQINPDAVPGDTTTNNVDEGDGGEGDYAEGTTAEGNSGSDAGETNEPTTP
ncbi:MAG: hypothetical protein PHH00_02100 [Candidatus Nanoarchaeia archaeon]|nr:hypothetical protein [Candidatus Nanoarchaeia archaeon]